MKNIIRGRFQRSAIKTYAARGVALRVNIDQKRLFPFCAEPCGNIYCAGRLTHAAFLVRHGNYLAHVPRPFPSSFYYIGYCSTYPAQNKEKSSFFCNVSCETAGFYRVLPNFDVSCETFAVLNRKKY